MPSICEHEPALYSWDSDGANSINAFSDRLWFVKCKQCCKRSNLAVDPSLAELYWNSGELTCDASDVFSSAIFHQMLPLDGCEHKHHAYIETPIGWMAYCTQCNIHTPIVASCEKAERLWHSKLYLRLDEDNAREYLKLKDIFSAIKNHVSYIKTFWGLLKKKSYFRRTHSTEVGLDITRRIRILYKICCGAKLVDDLGEDYDSTMDHIEVDIVKIESDKLEV